MNWGQIFRNSQINGALQKLSTTTNLDFKTTYHVSRIVAKVDSQQREADQMFQKLLDKYGTKDEKGNHNIPEENREAFQKDFEEFKNTKFDIDKNKINIINLKKVGLTASDLLSLEPILYGLDLIEGGFDGEEKENQKSC